MKKEELKINKINVEHLDNNVRMTRCGTIKEIKQEIENIIDYMEQYYNYKRAVIIKVFNEVDLQKSDIVTIFERLDKLKDERIDFRNQLNAWYEYQCYKNEHDITLVEDFGYILNKINSGIEYINPNKESQKELDDININELIIKDLKCQYDYMIKRINRSIRKINELEGYVDKYITSEEE